MLYNYYFKFLIENKQSNISDNNMVELFFDEHIEEVRQRLIQIFGIIILSILISFINVQYIVKWLELPIKGVKFFQSSPGEYFVSTLSIAFYSGLLFSLPIILSQLIFFLLPGLNKSEKTLVLGLLISSILLFILGLLFSYFILTPAALQFFIDYSSPVLEPLLSFNQYFSFISVLFLSTGIVFQVPILQVLFSLSQLVNPTKMLQGWRYMIIFSTIIGAILTPSADPFTQLLLAGALFLLYLSGCIVSLAIVKNRST